MRAERGQARRLRLRVEAHVVGVEAVVEARLLVLRRFERAQHGVHAAVAVDVHVDLPAGVPERAHAGGQHLGRHQPFAVVAIGVAGRAHLHELREDRAIREQLHAFREQHATRPAPLHAVNRSQRAFEIEAG